MHRRTLDRRRILGGSKDYVSSNLYFHYDGINNIGSGHSNTTKTWYDISGNENHLALASTDGLTWHDNYITYNTGIKNSAWILMPVTPDYTLEYLLSTSVEPSAASNMNFYTFTASYSSNINFIRLPSGVYIRIKGVRYNFTFDSTPDILHLITVVVKPPSEIAIYCNGNLIERRLEEVPALDCVYGALGFNNGPDAALSGDVKLAACRFYDRALTDGEIRQNYTKDKERYSL